MEDLVFAPENKTKHNGLLDNSIFTGTSVAWKISRAVSTPEHKENVCLQFHVAIYISCCDISFQILFESFYQTSNWVNVGQS